MSMAVDNSFDQLRGSPSDRPTFSPDFRKELRAEIESALRPVVGPLKISKGHISKVLQCEGYYEAPDDFTWRRPNVKGTLVHKALEIACGPTGRQPADTLVNIAMSKFEAGGLDSSIYTYFTEIETEERQEIETEAVADVNSFLEMFPPFQTLWNPSPEVWTAVWIGQKRVTFNGKIDLRLGSTNLPESSTLLIDFKTGKPTYDDMQDLRFYALLEALSYPKPPFRWANVYLGNSHVMAETASEELLWIAARRLIEGTLKIHEVTNEREAKLTPGSACKFCPANTYCVSARDNEGSP